jgi:hypothetical protein
LLYFAEDGGQKSELALIERSVLIGPSICDPGVAASVAAIAEHAA